MKTKLARYAALGVAIAIITIPAAAQQRGSGKKIRAACAADFQRLCPGIGRNEMRSCVREKAEELSDGCKVALQQLRGARNAGRDAGPAPSTSAPSTPPNE